MPGPLPKPRSSLTTVTGITTNNAYNSNATPWSTTRCHRLLRPLAAKLQALRNIIQNNPSATSANAARPKPKRDLTDPDALFVEVVEKAAGGRGSGASSTRFRARPRRTYGGGNASSVRSGGGSSAPAPAPAPATITATTSSSAIDDYLSIWGESMAPTAPTDPNPPKKPNRLPQDPNNPLALLNSFRPVLHPSIFSVYLGIYTSLESVLLSTNHPSPGHQVLPLRTLAARKIAHCILATSSEVESDDIWYDAAAELGSSGEYLREVVRWHAIELVRDVIAEGLMNGRDGGMGMAGVLVGLCRTAGAEQEAQSLLQTLFDLHPVISSSNNPAFQALTMFFSETPEVVYRFLAKNFPVTSSNPSWLGSTDIHAFLLLASTDIDDNPGIEVLASRALEATFGLWGEEHILVLSAQRHNAAKRRAPRRGAKNSLDTIPDDDDSAPRKPPASTMPARIGLKAETLVLKMVESLLLLSLQDHSSKATLVLRSLVHGFLAQSAAIKTTTEDVWGARYPVAAKVAILLYGLGESAEDDVRIVDETACCLEDVCGSGGNDGMKSLASFIAACYIPLYRRASKRDEVQILATRLISLAAANPARVASGVAPTTPRVPASRAMVTFTPGKPALAPAQELRETKRYLLAQLALQIAVGFSLSGKVKSDVAWIEWLGRFEHKVIGLKIQTPGRVNAILRQRELEAGAMEDDGETKSRHKTRRKGWRYEEGLDLWVAVGATPGRPRKQRGIFVVCVEVVINEDRDWRAEYEVLDTACKIIYDITDSDSESEVVYIAERPVTPTATTYPPTSDDSDDDNVDDDDDHDDDDDDDDDDDEFYSNIRTSPPRTLRRSPRNTARIRRSLTSFAVIMSSPILTRLRAPALRGSGLRKSFDLCAVESSSPMNSSPALRRGGFWSGDIESMGGGDSSPVRRNVRRVVSDMEDENENENEDEQEQYEFEMDQDISTIGPGGMKFSSAYTSPLRTSASAASKRKWDDISLVNLMDTTSSSDAETGDEVNGDETDIELDGDGDETEGNDEAELFRTAINTALPASSPPPPTPPSIPRRPGRISFGATRSRTVTPPPKTVLVPRLNSNVAPTPQRKIAEDSRQQRKIGKSAKRRRMGGRRKKARRLVDDGLSEDELGL